MLIHVHKKKQSHGQRQNRKTPVPHAIHEDARARWRVHVDGVYLASITDAAAPRLRNGRINEHHWRYNGL